ncbi:MAG: YebC/PmpR family DNA-binding transcriptional regulator [Candidatus Andersenbacteria bacterium]
MSGHSKWATTKRQKAVVDAKRGKVFTKLANAIALAARQGGGDPAANPNLRLLVDKAREANMPGANVERAIKRGTGQLEGVTFEEFTYEAAGPGGSAFIIEGVTDKKTRTVADVRQLLTHHGAKLAAAGSQLWQFQRLGRLQVPLAADQSATMQLEQIQLEMIELGAQDVQTQAGGLLVYVQPGQLGAMRQKLSAKGFTASEASLVFVPTNRIALPEAEHTRAQEILTALENHDDVQQVAVNF